MKKATITFFIFITLLALFPFSAQAAYFTVPVDVAESLFANLEQRTDWEMQVIVWSVVLVAFGLIISFMKFLRIFRTILMVLTVMASSVLIAHFLWNSNGFTYILPSVYGWRHAEARYELGCMYENGEGCIADVEKAIEWYDAAAWKGHSGAKEALIRLKADS